jgi:hypothetical protein
MKYPGPFGWVDVQEARDLVEALSIACEELSYRVEELDDTGDYEPEDIENMSTLAERVGALYERAVIARDGAERAEATVIRADGGTP